MATPLQNIQTIHNQLNDLTITDPQAKLLEEFFEQSIALLEGFKDPGNDLFEPRKRTILRRLISEQVQYQQGYWGKTDKVEKINGFMQARGQLHLLLSQALSNCQPREVKRSGLNKLLNEKLWYRTFLVQDKQERLPSRLNKNRSRLKQTSTGSNC